MQIKMSTRLVVLTKTKAFKIPLESQRMVARNKRRQGLEGLQKKRLSCSVALVVRWVCLYAENRTY